MDDIVPRLDLRVALDPLGVRQLLRPRLSAGSLLEEFAVRHDGDLPERQLESVRQISLDQVDAGSRHSPLFRYIRLHAIVSEDGADLFKPFSSLGKQEHREAACLPALRL